MERELSYEDMEEIAGAMSEVAGRLFPGMSLSYGEKPLLLIRSRAERERDVRECRLLMKSPGLDRRAVESAVVDAGDEPAGRKELLRRLASYGWPDAGSPEEMRLKLAAMGDGAFTGVCALYAEFAEGGYLWA